MDTTTSFSTKRLSNGYTVNLMRSASGGISVAIIYRSTTVSMMSTGTVNGTGESYMYTSVGRREYAATALAGWQWARTKCYVLRETYVLGRQLLLMHVCRTRISEHRHALTHDSAVLLTELMRGS